MKTIRELNILINEQLEIRRKKYEKKIFIMKFIDEIPELSYYEAKQLEKKLGNIYLEWNDEIYDDNTYRNLLRERNNLFIYNKK
jgi:hypothetical protein